MKKEADETHLVIFSFLLWLCAVCFMAHLGFGADADSWLMAQTAQKIRLGLGYDPARSFGNPAYEFMLACLQPNLKWLYSNLVNVFVASLLLYRVPAYFPQFTKLQVSSTRILWMFFPIFISASCSSMEYISGLLFLMEAQLAIWKGRTKSALPLVLLAGFTRIEFLPFLLLANLSFWRRNRFPLILALGLWASFLFWVWGKNPAPFQDFDSAIHFYLSRIAVLFQSAGMSFFIIILLLVWALRHQSHIGLWAKIATLNLLFFMLFPFEWEYAIPFFMLMLASLAMKIAPLPGVVLSLIFLFCYQVKFDNVLLRKGEIRLVWKPLWQTRSDMLNEYQLAQTVDFPTKTLLLYGATWFPTDVTRWEKSLDNRLFHRKGSNFFVGEKLENTPVLDSLIQNGFSVLKSKTAMEIR